MTKSEAEALGRACADFGIDRDTAAKIAWACQGARRSRFEPHTQTAGIHARWGHARRIKEMDTDDEQIAAQG